MSRDRLIPIGWTPPIPPPRNTVPLLVDAYNVLHVVGVLPPDLAGIDLEELAILITNSRFRGEEAVLVCDGVSKPHQVDETGRVHVRFAGPGVTADDLILRLVRGSSAPRRLTVVTSDREIVVNARRRRATVISSEAFLEFLASDRQRPASGGGTPTSTPASQAADRRQVEHWLRVFGVDEELLDLGSGAIDADATADLPAPKSPAPPSAEPDPPDPPMPRPGDHPDSRPIMNAEHLDEIRTEDVRSLDMNHLLGDADEPTPPAPPLPDETDSNRG
jgi:predicted RNA-binding protein with PIN domain